MTADPTIPRPSGATEPAIVLSLVVCTRNRAEHLPAALQSYAGIVSRLPWELIVVNNGSTDHTARVIEEFVALGAVRTVVVYEPRAGLSRARNAGWRRAAGAIIAFTDDDCYTNCAFVEQIEYCMRERSLEYLGGQVLLHDPDDAPVTIQPRTTPVDLRPGAFIPPGLIHGANMAFRRSVFERLNGFDELLGAGTPVASGEDVEFLSRAAAAGFAGGYDPRPSVRHHHRRRTREQLRRLNRSYDIGRGAYYMACMFDDRRPQALQSWSWTVLRGSDWSRRPWSFLLSYLRELRGAAAYWMARKRSARQALAAPPPGAMHCDVER